MKILVVVDMQNDFIGGSLGSDAAKEIVPKVLDKIKSFEGRVIFTRDTHSSEYLTTREGRLLPVVHCIKNSNGWQICDELKEFATEVVDKTTFGSYDLPKVIGQAPDEIELCGLCTDICVISNAMILKAAYPETDIYVDSACCAGVTADSHKTALDAMRAVQIVVK
ncbi:MAG: cysteine hydrolase [Clostridia bacterium]|nr:cysteine hydrolase [Clostridia bacterium]